MLNQFLGPLWGRTGVSSRVERKPRKNERGAGRRRDKKKKTDVLSPSICGRTKERWSVRWIDVRRVWGALVE